MENANNRVDEWGEPYEEQEVTARGGVPKLGLFCGLGCLLMVVLGAVLSIGGYFLFQNRTDPEVLWPEIREHLPFDERPGDIEPHYGIPLPGQRQYELVHRQNEFTLKLLVFSGSDPSVRDMHMTTDSIVDFAFSRSEAGSMEVQGRECDCLWFWMRGGEGESRSGADGLRLDLTGRGERTVILEVYARGGQSLESENLERWLECFDLWRDR